MNPLDVWAISVVAGGAAGVLGGVAVNWLLDRDQRVIDAKPDDYLESGPSVGEDWDPYIERAASAWARDHQRPGAAPLAANKLRLALRLRDRRRAADARTRKRGSRS